MKFIPLLFILGTALAVPVAQSGQAPKEDCMKQGGQNGGGQQSGGQQSGGQQGGGQQMGQQGGRNGTCNAAALIKNGQLSGGIRTNIAIQQQELISVGTVQSLLLSNATGAQFEAERQALLVIQQMGVAIRTQNQQIAGEIQSASLGGLQTVEQAQQTEINQVKTLRGNQQADAQTLVLLVKEVSDGTAKNWANLAIVETECR